jgi:hypothetical protein
MRDNSLENGGLNPESVHLNQEFPLFSSCLDILPDLDMEGQLIFHSKVVLTSGVVPNFTVRINTFNVPAGPTHMITPFTPELGYQITDDDLELELRRVKVSTIEGLKSTPRLTQASSSLYVDLYNSWEFAFQGLSRWSESGGLVLTSEADLFLKNLAFRVKVNGLAFEGHSWSGTGYQSIKEFFPLDMTGPLPAPLTIREQYEEAIFEGFHLFLPSDLEKVQSMRGEFVLRKQEPQIITENTDSEIPQGD